MIDGAYLQAIRAQMKGYEEEYGIQVDTTLTPKQNVAKILLTTPLNQLSFKKMNIRNTNPSTIPLPPVQPYSWN